jgi:integrase/recombinase XerD
MKVQKIKLSSYEFSWLVLDNNHLPIQPITEFIRYINNIDKSPFTVRSYAYHLKLYWEFLESKRLDWKKINLSELTAFVAWLRELNDRDSRVIDLMEDQCARKPATINVILGCLSSFYRYHNQLGHTEVTITEPKNIAGNRYKALLHHVFKNKPIQRRIRSYMPLFYSLNYLPGSELIFALIGVLSANLRNFLLLIFKPLYCQMITKIYKHHILSMTCYKR